jgi:hypothetical protein
LPDDRPARRPRRRQSSRFAARIKLSRFRISDIPRLRRRRRRGRNYWRRAGRRLGQDYNVATGRRRLVRRSGEISRASSRRSMSTRELKFSDRWPPEVDESVRLSRSSFEHFRDWRA